MTPVMSPDQRKNIVQEAIRAFEGTGLQEIRGSREKLAGRAQTTISAVIQRMNIQVSSDDIAKMVQEVVAHIGGLGVLEPLLRPGAGLSEIVVTPAGTVWTLPKGAHSFVRLDAQPSQNEVWRAVEVLLSPLGRSCSEASPSVDAKIPRSPDLPGGARVKILHPVIAPGDGYPSINIRLFEPNPVPPSKIVQWGVAPEEVINGLVKAVGEGMRMIVIGGTASGKTTLLSALCYGIPQDARVVKIEDPEEIWLDHPHVVTIEARPAVIGSSVPAYTLANGVDDAMRMSPRWLIVGEMRRGDAVSALFRAQMSDHPGLSTFHAEGPEAAIHRMALLLFNDTGMRAEGAKDLFAQAVDVIVQVGWIGDSRAMIGVWEVGKALKAGNVTFRQVYAPGDDKLGEFELKRRL